MFTPGAVSGEESTAAGQVSVNPAGIVYQRSGSQAWLVDPAGGRQGVEKVAAVYICEFAGTVGHDSGAGVEMARSNNSRAPAPSQRHTTTSPAVVAVPPVSATVSAIVGHESRFWQLAGSYAAQEYSRQRGQVSGQSGLTFSHPA